MRTAALLIALAAAATLAACSPRKETPPEPANTAATAPETTAAAPAPDGARNDVKTFTVGNFSAIALRDGTLSGPNDNTVFGIGHTPAEVAALLTSAGLPADHLDLSIQPLLVKTADRVLLFDTGAGTNMGPNNGRLLASMAAAGVEPGAVTDIFISHAHGDHIGGLLNAQGALTFPNAAIHISSPEWSFLEGMSAEMASKSAIGQHAALIAAMTPKAVEFAPGAELIAGVVKAVDIKGHTPGHSGYLITSGPQSLLYMGDTMHHFVVSVQRPDWSIQYDTDAPTAQASRKALLTQSAASGQRIYAVHFPFPGLGKFAQKGDGFVWIPE